MAKTKSPDPREVARRCQQRLYEPVGGRRLAAAAAWQLSGRSYYYGDVTRRVFGSRVMLMRTEREGMLLSTVESFVSQDGRRAFRPVVFDLLGDIVTPICHYGQSTRRHAEKCLDEFLASYPDTESECSRVMREALKRTNASLVLLKTGEYAS